MSTITPTETNKATTKIFIIGLPRTGTTSISVAMLDAGFKVAHTAFTQQCFVLADVITDAPCFSDFEQLDKLFPNSKFVYLERSLSQWLPSMQRLLVKMSPQLTEKGSFSPVLKRSFNETFDLMNEGLMTDEHLTQCYLAHQQHVMHYFKDRNDLLSIDISVENSYQRLCEFLSIPFSEGKGFPHLNVGNQVSKWKQVKHDNKVSSFSAGVHHRQFFDYKSGTCD